jgi:hypothetical protein
MKNPHALLAGACLAALLAAPASANDNAFGPLRQLAGSCWKAEAAPALEVCYGFDGSGRTLTARQYVGGRVFAESSLVESSRPGWLIETTRWTHAPYSVVYRLHIDPVDGRLSRELVRPNYDARRADVERRPASEVVDSIRMVGTDRFVWVRRTPVNANRDWTRQFEPTVATWNFWRSRPCDAEDLATVLPNAAPRS